MQIRIPIFSSHSKQYTYISMHTCLAHEVVAPTAAAALIISLSDGFYRNFLGRVPHDWPIKHWDKLLHSQRGQKEFRH